jgi:hypothetical protein
MVLDCDVMADEPNDRPAIPDEAAPAEDPLGFYTAFGRYKYEPIFYKAEHKQSWRDMGNSYYWACRPLVEALAQGKLNEDMEGTAAIFLFRHYLEVMLKRIVLAGRMLASDNELATREQIKEVARRHNLQEIWGWVLADAKPKINEFDNYDIAFLESCINEFHTIDEQGFAFRYDGQGAEMYRFDFGALYGQMEHIRLILEGIWTCLDQTLVDICEYNSYMKSEYGNENDW